MTDPNPRRLWLGFFSSLGFPDLETGSCRGGGCQLCHYYFSSRLSGDNKITCGNRFFRGGSANVSSFFSSRLSGFGNRFVCLLYAQGGVDQGSRSTQLRHRYCPKSTVSSIFLVRLAADEIDKRTRQRTKCSMSLRWPGTCVIAFPCTSSCSSRQRPTCPTRPTWSRDLLETR